MTDAVEIIRAEALGGMPHGFLGRRGGVSEGMLAGLNVGLGSDDDRHAIAENRRRAVEAVAPGARLVTLHQVHSAKALTVTPPWPDDARPQADAGVTDRPGLLLGILTADRSEEHTSELQSLMRNPYAALCLKKKKTTHH